MGKAMRNRTALIIFLLSMLLPWGDLLAGELVFPQAVLDTYDQSLDAVGRGNIEEFRERVGELKNELYRIGLVSINSFVEESLSRSYALEREKRLTVARISLQVSPLNVKYWLYLGLNDLLDFNMYAFWNDLLNMYQATLKNPIPLLKSTYVMFAFFIFFLLFLCFFFSLGILFKYFSSLVSDLFRVKALQKVRFLVAPMVLCVLILPVYLLRSPFTVLYFWLILFAPYMVHREFIITLIVGFLIIATIMINDKVGAYSQMAISPARKNLFHLAHGITSGVRDVEVDLSEDYLISSAGKVRYSYLMEKYRDSIGIAEDLEQRVGMEYGVFVSMGRFSLGDQPGAISKMIEVSEGDVQDPVVLFNLYQLYMTSYNFDEAAKIQKRAWRDIAGARPFQIDPSKVDEKLLIPPAIPGKYFWLFMDDLGKEGEGELPFSTLWVNPWRGGIIFFSLFMVLLVGIKVVSYNRYLILACRVCGYKQLWKVSLKKDDICQYCKSKSHHVKGAAGIPEKVYQIKSHKRGVRVKSLIIPGFGFLSVGAVSMFFFISIVISSLIALFVLFFFAFPGDYSPLYAVISRLGTVVIGVLVLAMYLFILITNDLVLRRIHKKHRVEVF